MKKIGRFICFTTLFLLIAGCKQQKTIRYELVDGNLNPEKPDVPLNKNDAFQKVQKRRVQEKR